MPDLTTTVFMLCMASSAFIGSAVCGRGGGCGRRRRSDRRAWWRSCGRILAEEPHAHLSAPGVDPESSRAHSRCRCASLGHAKPAGWIGDINLDRCGREANRRDGSSRHSKASKTSSSKFAFGRTSHNNRQRICGLVEPDRGLMWVLWQEAKSAKDDSGACLTMVMFRNRSVHVGWCGDCRAIIVRDSGLILSQPSLCCKSL